VEMLGANPREVRDLCVSENLLASFDGYHGASSHNLWSDLNFKSSRTIRTRHRLCLSSQREKTILHKPPYQRQLPAPPAMTAQDV
jgi:hypothetical protein